MRRFAVIRERARDAIGMAAGQVAGFFLRLMGRGATSLPGKAALWISPNILGHLTRGRQVFLVTGTNGKTTTVRLLCHLLEEQGRVVITNPSGANLASGLVTTLIQNRRRLAKALSAGQKAALVFEMDEAYFGRLARELKPDICVVTNFFRDQLDRFGELSHTRDLIASGLSACGAKAVLCADDPLCAGLGRNRPFPTVYFGMSPPDLETDCGQAPMESVYCLFCGGRYQYERVYYGHLGLYRCDGCGYRRPCPDLSFSVLSDSEKGLELEVRTSSESVRFTFPIPGLYNAYNAAAALLAGTEAGIPLSSAAALTKAKAAFGRMERFSIGDRDVCIILVKNPAGMDRALSFLQRAGDVGAVMMLLNANDPDGRDVSWIWDVLFEDRLPGRIGVSGKRCHDLALRLYYAGKTADELAVSKDHMALFDKMLADCPPGRCLYLLPNYTAMLTIRADLRKRYPLPAFWT